jgi:hypothetical protein
LLKSKKISKFWFQESLLKSWHAHLFNAINTTLTQQGNS